MSRFTRLVAVSSSSPVSSIPRIETGKDQLMSLLSLMRILLVSGY
jgi:hypothetical protein